jgi:hypothetical protein
MCLVGNSSSPIFVLLYRQQVLTREARVTNWSLCLLIVHHNQDAFRQHVLSCCCACLQVHVVYEGAVTLSHQQLLALMHYGRTLNNTINWSNKVSRATLY